MSRVAFAAALVAVLFGLYSPVTAQESSAAKDAIDVTYVTDEFIAAAVVHPARLLKSKALAALPLDAVVASAKESFGVDLQTVERITFLLPSPAEGRDVDSFLGIVRFSRRVDAKAIVAAFGGGKPEKVIEETVGGKKVLTLADGPPVGFYLPDPQTVVVAELDQFKTVLAGRGGKSALAKKLASMDADHDVLAVVDAKPLREIVKMLGAQQRGDEAVFFAIANELLTKIDSYAVTIDLSPDILVRAQIESPDAESAQLVHDLARGWLAAVKLVAPVLKETLAEEESFPPKLAENVGKLFDAILRNVTIEQQETSVAIQWKLTDEVPLLVATVSEAVEHARDSAKVVQSMNNLHNLAIAVHNHLDLHARFPARANFSADGKPLLSWRVHLLPFLEADGLYKEFRLDEPWDSEHNKKLIDRMPSVFTSPNADLGKGKTCYLAVVAENSMFPTAPPTGEHADTGLSDLTEGAVLDGLSNTMMFVEAAPEEAVIWTRPDDWEMDADKPRKGLFGMQRGFALAAFADASIQRIPEKASDKAIILAAGRNDRQHYSFEEEEERGDEDKTDDHEDDAESGGAADGKPSKMILGKWDGEPDDAPDDVNMQWTFKSGGEVEIAMSFGENKQTEAATWKIVSEDEMKLVMEITVGDDAEPAKKVTATFKDADTATLEAEGESEKISLTRVK